MWYAGVNVAGTILLRRCHALPALRVRSFHRAGPSALLATCVGRLREIVPYLLRGWAIVRIGPRHGGDNERGRGSLSLVALEFVMCVQLSRYTSHKFRKDRVASQSD
jgi:hypothetical protein